MNRFIKFFVISFVLQFVLLIPNSFAIGNKTYGLIVFASSSATARYYLPAMREKKTVVIDHMRYVTGKIGYHTVVFNVSEVGKINTAMVVTAMIKDFHPQGIILTGNSVGINPILRVGDIVIPTSVHQVAQDTKQQGTIARYMHPFMQRLNPQDISIDNFLIKRLGVLIEAHSVNNKEGFKVIFGQAASAPTLPLPLDQLQKLAKQGFDIVDQEDFIGAQIGLMSNIPILTIRVVSDNPLADKMQSPNYRHYSILSYFRSVAEKNLAAFVVQYLQALT